MYKQIQIFLEIIYHTIKTLALPLQHNIKNIFFVLLIPHRRYHANKVQRTPMTANTLSVNHTSEKCNFALYNYTSL